MFNRMTSLWMGDLDPYMDENFLKQAFSTMGETAYGVKIITHRVTGGSAGYCFVEMADEASVDRCVHRLNGKLVPGSNPPRKFKLNYATYGKRPEGGPEFTVFVGDLSSEVDDYQLHQFFVKKYPSCKGGKVVTDQYSNSRGYGFVKFGDEGEQKKAIEECQSSTGLGGKPIRISIAVNKSHKSNNYHNNQNHSYHNNYPQQQQQGGYYGGHNHNYYPQWGSYDQYNSYNYGYNPYGGYPPPGPHGMMPPPPMGMPPMQGDMSATAEQTQEAAGETEEEMTEEPNPQLDVEALNRDFMERSEELYDSLMNCHWQPLDSITSEVPSVSSS